MDAITQQLDFRSGRGRPLSIATENLIRKLYREDGFSYRLIAQELNDQGIPTAHGGKSWCEGTVQQVLERLEEVVLEPNASAKAIEVISRMKAQTPIPPYVDIAAHLNSHNILSPGGKTWHPSSVYKQWQRIYRAKTRQSTKRIGAAL